MTYVARGLSSDSAVAERVLVCVGSPKFLILQFRRKQKFPFVTAQQQPQPQQQNNHNCSWVETK